MFFRLNVEPILVTCATAMALEDAVMPVAQAVAQLGGEKASSLLEPPKNIPSTVDARRGRYGVSTTLQALD